jgi:hypothetical protein
MTQCKRPQCLHTWESRTDKPKCCPACKRYGFDQILTPEQFRHIDKNRLKVSSYEQYLKVTEGKKHGENHAE